MVTVQAERGDSLRPGFTIHNGMLRPSTPCTNPFSTMTPSLRKLALEIRKNLVELELDDEDKLSPDDEEIVLTLIICDS